MPIQMSTEQLKIASELFASAPDKREGKTRLTVRFDPKRLALYPGDAIRRTTPLAGATLQVYKETPARTPTGGRYIRKSLTVRTSDGRIWWGDVKKGTDVVKLRLAPKEDETD